VHLRYEEYFFMRGFEKYEQCVRRLVKLNRKLNHHDYPRVDDEERFNELSED